MEDSSQKRHIVTEMAVLVPQQHLLAQNGKFCPKNENLPKPHANYLFTIFLVYCSEGWG